MKFRTRIKIRDGLRLKHRDGFILTVKTPTLDRHFNAPYISRCKGWLLYYEDVYWGWEMEQTIYNPQRYKFLE